MANMILVSDGTLDGYIREAERQMALPPLQAWRGASPPWRGIEVSPEFLRSMALELRAARAALARGGDWKVAP